MENISWHFHPAILSTCRVVHEEATATLYGENVFQFEENGADEEGNQDCSIPEQCENIFKYNVEDWRQADKFTQLKDSTFACFLNRIGHRNAAGLKAVKFVGIPSDIGRYGFNLKANLLKRHLLGLKHIKFSVITRPIIRLQIKQRYDGGAGHRQLFPNRDMELHRICRMLTELVRGCPSIEEFEYRGSGFKTIADLETKPEYWGKLLELLKERKKKKAPHLARSKKMNPRIRVIRGRGWSSSSSLRLGMRDAIRKVWTEIEYEGSRHEARQQKGNTVCSLIAGLANFPESPPRPVTCWAGYSVF